MWGVANREPIERALRLSTMSLQRLAGGAARCLPLLLIAACGAQTEPLGAEPGQPAEPRPPVAAKPSVNLVPDGYDGRLRTRATVLESPRSGPQLCSAVMESYPPQCSGPPIKGWDWSAVRAESAAGTRWGAYVLTGTYDGTTFTLSEPARPDNRRARGPAGGDELSTPCPAPRGGWGPVEPAKATQASYQAATRAAQTVAGFGGVWIDQQIPAGQLTERNANDPKRFVLNITTAGDPAEIDQAVRAVWGGALCVSPVARSAAELAQVVRSLPDIPGVISQGTNTRTGQVELALVIARESLQRQLDERFGAGVVRLSGALEPID
jgi:hypothetical protein